MEITIKIEEIGGYILLEKVADLDGVGAKLYRAIPSSSLFWNWLTVASSLPKQKILLRPCITQLYQTRHPMNQSPTLLHPLRDSPVVAAEASSCQWSLDDDDMGTWATGCGGLLYFEYDGIKENGFIFCPYCGERIEEVRDE